MALDLLGYICGLSLGVVEGLNTRIGTSLLQDRLVVVLGQGRNNSGSKVVHQVGYTVFSFFGPRYTGYCFTGQIGGVKMGKFAGAIEVGKEG